MLPLTMLVCQAGTVYLVLDPPPDPGQETSLTIVVPAALTVIVVPPQA
jgi:hypothetical protein